MTDEQWQTPDAAATAGGEWAMGDESDWTIDFSKVEDVPAGVLLLQITRYTRGMSKKGNRKVDVQYTVLDGADGKYNGRKVFDTITIKESTAWRCKAFAKAFLGEAPSGPYSFANDAAFLGQQAWNLVIAEAGSGEYSGSTRSRIQTYGAKPPA